MSSSGLDRIARELAAGEISRRSALKRLAGAGLGLGAMAAPAGVAEAMGGSCPPGRKKCGSKCCPKNARCQNGRCKCKPGFKKCGKKCVDLDTSVKHCGACGNRCDEGQSCVNGECASDAECIGPEDCPQGTAGDCKMPTCEGGVCGFANDDADIPSPPECQIGLCFNGDPTFTALPPGAPCSTGECDGAGACV